MTTDSTDKLPSDTEKAAVWTAYRERRPTRVPLRWNVNCRILLLDPALNPDGWTFQQYVYDPDIHIRIRIRFQEYYHGTISRVCDSPSTLPERWSAGPDVHNTYDAAYFGGTITFRDGQVPAVEAFLSGDDVDDFLRRDFSDVPANPFVRERLAFRDKLEHAARGGPVNGKPVQVNPFVLGFDGPVTAAAAIFGTDFFLLLGEDPEKASRVLEKITRDVLHRNRTLRRLAGLPEKTEGGGLADDSVQLIGREMYEHWVLPWHALYYDESYTSTAASRSRGMHLCGDATRHFKTIRDRLGVQTFDTGFPVDHGALRAELGPDIEISGGPHVALLQAGSPGDCSAEAVRILRSGVMTGGRFILQEGNNLAPCTPLDNLAAVYAACREISRYGGAQPS